MRDLLDFLAGHYHWLLFALLETVCGVLIFRSNNYQSSVWVSSANVVAGKIHEWSSSAEAFFSLAANNEMLMRRNYSLERKVQALTTLYAAATGDTLATDSGKMAALAPYGIVAAKVVSNSVNKPDNLMTIDKGSSSGVRPDMGVACGMGVVGVTYLVSRNYSVVIPLLNDKSRISCTIRGRGYFGYLHWTGGEPSIAYLEDVPRHARFKIGDWVETNGYSSIFPPGILVGRITQAYNSRDGLSYRLRVSLSVDFSRLRDVCVITDTSFVERAALMHAAQDSIRDVVGN